MKTAKRMLAWVVFWIGNLVIAAAIVITLGVFIVAGYHLYIDLKDLINWGLFVVGCYLALLGLRRIYLWSVEAIKK